MSTILRTFKHETRTVIIARYGLLECGGNFKGAMTEMCNQCCTIDDENHRLNDCSILYETNWANSDQKIDFNDIHSNDDSTVTYIVERLECIWEFRYANGRMKRK